LVSLSDDLIMGEEGNWFEVFHDVLYVTFLAVPKNWVGFKLLGIKVA
jgi:hypothetical protein